LNSATPRAREQINSFYEPHLKLSERLYHRYTGEQMELLLEFIRAGREFNERAAAKVERQNRRSR
jgi:hypothetical protein